MTWQERAIFTCLMLFASLFVPLWGFKGLYEYLLGHPAIGITFIVFIALINFGIYYFVFLSGSPKKPKINKKPGHKYCEKCTEEMGLLASFCCYCGERLGKSKEKPTKEHINAEAEFAKTLGGRCGEAYHKAILGQLKAEKLFYPRCFCALCGQQLL